MIQDQLDTKELESTSISSSLTEEKKIVDDHVTNSSEHEKLTKEVSQQKNVQRVITNLEDNYGALGPLEEPYDVRRVLTFPDPSSSYNADDPWQYPIDEEFGLRIVDFRPGDKKNPKNFSKAFKWLCTGLLGFTCFIVALGSAIVTGDLDRPAAYLGVSEEVIILASVTVFVIGFGVGPCLFAPLSEELGRKIIYTTTLFAACIFIIPCALAKNIATLLVCRLIDGIFFSAPMTLIGGSLADLWEGPERGVAMAIFSAAPFLGPVMGPLFGGLLHDHASTWRWIYWAFLIIASFNYVIFIGIVPETHGPTLLKRRAKMLRKNTGDQNYKSLSELRTRTFKEIAQNSLLRPFALLSEIIVMLITLYMSVNYGLLYMFFFAYPMIYQEGKGWSATMTGVMFLPIGVGVICSTLVAPLFNKQYNKRAQVYRDRGELPPAELRLLPMMYSCWSIPIGLFPYAWSSYPRISWAGPCFSGFAAGFGFCAVYNPGNNYIVDSYQHFAASGLAAKTLVRSLWGAVVPLFTIQMYHRLGYEWATSLMGFISLACCAIPFLFYVYGARIRKFSRYAYSPEYDKN